MKPTRLILGTAQLADPYGLAASLGRPQGHCPEAILDRALELGVAAIDTAPGYRGSEEAIGAWRAKGGRRTDMRLCTKLAALPAQLESHEIAGFVAEAVEKSQKRLRCEILDVLLLHAPTDLLRWGEALVDALEQTRHEGRIRRAGVSIYDPEDSAMMRTHAELTTVQLPLNVFDQRALQSGCVRDHHRAGHVVDARSPLLQGLLTHAPQALTSAVAEASPWLARLRALFARFDVEPAAGALAWAAQAGECDHVVLGIDEPDQLTAAREAIERSLPVELIEAIGHEFASVPAGVRDPRLWPDSERS